MNANAAKLVEIAREARLVHTGNDPGHGALDGQLDRERISTALCVSVSTLVSWTRETVAGVPAAKQPWGARACPGWAPRLLLYLVNDPESPVYAGKRKSTMAMDKAESGYSEIGQVTSERPTPTLAPIRWGVDLR